MAMVKLAKTNSSRALFPHCNTKNRMVLRAMKTTSFQTCIKRQMKTCPANMGLLAWILFKRYRLIRRCPFISPLLMFYQIRNAPRYELEKQLQTLLLQNQELITVCSLFLSKCNSGY